MNRRFLTHSAKRQYTVSLRSTAEALTGPTKTLPLEKNSLEVKLRVGNGVMLGTESEGQRSVNGLSTVTTVRAERGVSIGEGKGDSRWRSCRKALYRASTVRMVAGAPG